MVATNHIGSVKIHYEDMKLKALISRLNSAHIDKLKNEPHVAKYNLPIISLPNLKKNNILVNYHEDGSFKAETTNISHATMDTILFSLFTNPKNNCPITTSAASCYSIMLSCKEMRLAAAMHIDCEHDMEVDGLSAYKDIFLMGYINMNRLVNNKYRLNAYISGGFNAPKVLMKYQEELKENNRTIFKYLLPEIIKRGVFIKRIDVGGNYSFQCLNLYYEKYKTVLEF